MTEKKLFWSGNFNWRYGDNGIVIGGKEYGIRELFPELYFLTSEGCTLEKIKASFPDIDAEKTEKAVRFLLDMGVLADRVQSPDKLFERQYSFYPRRGEYPDDILLHSELIEELRKKALDRQSASGSGELIRLESSVRVKPERRSIRNFAADKQVTVKQFSKLLDTMRQERSGDEITYAYPSAGGLYPIDIYICVKSGRVEGIEGGIYEYLPAEHSLRPVSGEQIPAGAHYYINKAIFSSSAFSMYFFYDTDASMPKYHGLGYYYAVIDSGIMLGKLSDSAHQTGLGSCIIGVLNYSKAEKYFGCGENKIYLHCMEFGIPSEQ